MFDKLIDVLLLFLDLFRGWTVCQEGTRVVIFTLGRVTRVCGPKNGWFYTGFHPKLCLGIEKDTEVCVRDERFILTNQSLSTSDGKKVTISGAFTYAIRPDRVVEWLVECGDENLLLPASLKAAIAETLIRHSLTELLEKDELKDLRQEILDRGRKELKKWGYEVSDFKWIDRAEARIYRLITGD